MGRQVASCGLGQTGPYIASIARAESRAQDGNGLWVCSCLGDCGIGSPGRIRTSDLAVNSRLLYR